MSSSRRSSSGPSGSRAGSPGRAAASRKPKHEPVAEAPKPPTRPPPRPPSRFGVSPGSRLTIKPSPPQGPRPPLELSTKVRPSGRRPLSEVQLDEDEVLVDWFYAILGGATVKVTAVLERTCVYIDSDGDRRLARKEDMVVEADKLPIRRRGFG